MDCKKIYLIVLLWTIFKSSNCCETQKLKFSKTQICPSSSSFDQLSKLDGSHDLKTCVFKCAVSSTCAVIFQSSSKLCYFGDSEQLSTLFSSTNTSGTEQCESYIKVWNESKDMSSTTTAPTTQNSMTTTTQSTAPPPPSLSDSILSKLVIFFDFRKSYFNLINPSKYMATPRGSLTQDSDGVHFPGNSDQDFIEVDTDGNTLASTYLAESKKFTIYSRTYREGSHQTYHYFYDCSSTVNRGEFFDDDGKINVVHPLSGSVIANNSGTVLYFTSINQVASVGVIFNGSTVTNFYHLGSLKAVNSGSTTISGTPLCLRLGYNSNPSYSLKGRFLCYAIANDTLTESELTEIGLYFS